MVFITMSSPFSKFAVHAIVLPTISGASNVPIYQLSVCMDGQDQITLTARFGNPVLKLKRGL